MEITGILPKLFFARPSYSPRLQARRAIRKRPKPTTEPNQSATVINKLYSPPISLLAFALSAIPASSQTTIIGGSLGNADFNAGGGGTNGGAQDYDATDNWFNAGPSGGSWSNFTQSTQMGGSNDPDNGTTTRGAFGFQNRNSVNDTEHTVQAEDVGKAFSVSYAFGAGGNAANWDNVETMRTYVFYTDDGEGNALPVDNSIGADNIVELGSFEYPVDRAGDGQWTFPTGPEFYTIVAEDVGRVLYFGMQFLDEEEGADALLYPRIDNIYLTLDTAIPPVTDPTIAIVSDSKLMSVTSPPGTATSTITIRNDSEVNPLSVNSFTPPAGTGFTVITPAPGDLPASVAVGAELEITVQWDSSAASSTYETGDLLINTNDPNNPSAPASVAGGTPTVLTAVLDNGDFETPGTDNVTDTDTFANWDETDDASTKPENVMDVPSFAPNSGTACYFTGGNAAANPGGVIEAPLDSGLTNAVVTFDFAFAESGLNTRKLGLIIDSGATNFTQVNIRYYGGAFQARGGAETGNAWFNIISDADLGGALLHSNDADGDGDLNGDGDVINLYKAVLSSEGWGTPNPCSVLEIQDSSGATLATSEPFFYFNGGAPPTDPETRITNIEVNAAFNNHPPSWIDNIVVNGSAFDIPAPEDFRITGFSVDRSTGIGSVTFISEDGVPYELHASNDLGENDPFPDNVITSGNGTGASTTLPFTDTAATTESTRTYRIFTP